MHVHASSDPLVWRQTVTQAQSRPPCAHQPVTTRKEKVKFCGADVIGFIHPVWRDLKIYPLTPTHSHIPNPHHPHSLATTVAGDPAIKGSDNTAQVSRWHTHTHTQTQASRLRRVSENCSQERGPRDRCEGEPTWCRNGCTITGPSAKSPSCVSTTRTRSGVGLTARSSSGDVGCVWVGVLFGPRKRLGREVGEATTRKSDNGESMV
jgi:hypothetical protein